MARPRYEVQHVLMTADAVGGVWTYCLELARDLAKWDIRVSLATMGPRPTPDQAEEALAIPGLELFASDFKLEWMDDPWRDVDAAGDWLLNLADRVKPDLIHLNGYCHATLDWQVPVISVAHSDVVSWWWAVRREEPPKSWNEYRRRVSAGLNAADLVIAPTSSMLRDLELSYGSLENKRVIYNGRSLESIRNQRKESFILSAGRLWDEAKNVAALSAVSSDLNWPVFLAGDEESGSGSVRRLGKLKPAELHSWMNRAAIYALPAKYEPFGLSILEAATHGCALVLGDIPTQRELWQGAAVFVDPDEPAALQDAICYLTNHESVRGQLGIAARKRSELYSTRAFGCGYLFAYQDLKQGSELLRSGALDGVSML